MVSATAGALPPPRSSASTLTVTAVDADATRAIGAALGGCLPPGALVALSGGLGAGKTTFVQGLASGLGYSGRVTSPTYTLVHLYALPAPPTPTARSTPGPEGTLLVHVDLYRIGSAAEARELGLHERRADGDRVVVEWPGNAGVALAEVDLTVAFTGPAFASDVDGGLEIEPPRVLDITAGTAEGAHIVACLANALTRAAAGVGAGAGSGA